MADMITLYAPEPPQPPHRCDDDGYFGFTAPEMRQGAVIECKTCGQLWYADVGTDNGDPPLWHVFWRKVRWYHFDLKEKARENG